MPAHFHNSQQILPLLVVILSTIEKAHKLTKEIKMTIDLTETEFNAHDSHIINLILDLKTAQSVAQKA